MTPESKRGRIQPPDLDDRTWQDLSDQMRALRTSYAPQWTDDRPSDIGITLIELFAWLGEGLIYRLNQVPEKNYIAFLNLMGITRDPTTPATTYLSFGAKGPTPVRVPAGTQAHTLPEEGEAPIVFETDEDVTVLPTALTTALLLTPDPEDDSQLLYDDVTADLVGPGTGRRPIGVPPGLTAHFCLGFEKAVQGEIVLRPRLFRPAPEAPAGSVTWAASVPGEQPGDWPEVGPAGTTNAMHDRPVTTSVPQSWAAQNPTQSWDDARPASDTAAFDAERFWIGLRIDNPSEEPLEIGLDRVLFNAAPAHTALTLRSPEMLGKSDGGTYQTFPLRHRPLYRGPDAKAPYAHVDVQVGQGTPPAWESWQQVPELLPGPGKVYRLNPVTGEVGFGSHDERRSDGHGSIPPTGSLIRARTYRHVASGSAGNVSPGRIVVMGTAPDGTVPGGLEVTNPAAANDGTDEEPIEDTLRRAPEELKIRDRAVTADDYAYLAREATSDVRISACLAPHPPRGTPWTFGGIDRAPGNVSVIVVPDQGDAVARPEPPPELIDAVRTYLDERRDLTVRLFVLGPRYLPVMAKVSIVVWREAALAGVDPQEVKAEVERKITAFLHPTRGGPAGRGWEVGQHVFSSDLFRAAMPPDDVGYIEQITVTAGPHDYPGERPFPQAPPGASVQVADYELVCAGEPDVPIRQSTS
ncbi:putative baseplate assembly protein [Streptomyces sp. NPDC058335]|uniref:putative baseplate assembly protein n=1 Tax=Streptomyces sp. NPDC058335 TaxID=3346451 RepID=UPI00366140B1